MRELRRGGKRSACGQAQLGLFVRPEPVTVAIPDDFTHPERETVVFFDFEKPDVYQFALDFVTRTRIFGHGNGNGLGLGLEQPALR